MPIQTVCTHTKFLTWLEQVRSSPGEPGSAGCSSSSPYMHGGVSQHLAPTGRPISPFSKAHVAYVLTLHVF